MVEGLLKDIAISFGFMAVFFGASLLFGTASEKKARVSYIIHEKVENVEGDNELFVLNR
ncbi:MAG: hypothetical protein LBR92_00200 [Puniceicoccales bacterium]|jgi:hypothetical protein|nr:hypothetical protein [Puniceicoccales bacterium]